MSLVSYLPRMTSSRDVLVLNDPYTLYINELANEVYNNRGLLKLFCSYKTELQSLYNYLQSRYSAVYKI